MLYLLDTDTVIFMVRSSKRRKTSVDYKKSRRLIDRARAELEAGERVGISAITRAELEYGAAKSIDPVKERAAVDKILAPFDEFDFDAGACALHYGAIRVELERAGELIGAMDLLIAAHARALKATLVSNNTRHFKRVKDAKVENWAE